MKGGNMNTIKFFNEIKEAKVSELGGKGYSLAVLTNNGFNVPKGFIISSQAFFEFLKYNNLLETVSLLTSEIGKENFQEKSKELKSLTLEGRIPDDITSEVRNNLDRLSVPYVSIRSSAVSEDNLKSSFAGLHDTFLNVKAESNLVLENIKKCWASLFNERALIYRTKKRMPYLEGMAIVVQEMILSEISGITFTVHPTDKKRLLIETSYGIGDIIVSGKVEPDDYVVDRETLEIVDRKIGRKDRMTIIENERTKTVNVEKELAEKQALSDNKLKEIARTSLKVEKIFNYPQDIEWCISNNKLWLLQSRAVTGMIK